MLNLIKKEKGFTLIELMIVVAIIGILAAIAIPQFASYRVKAFNAAAQSDLKTAQTTFEVFFNDNLKYPNAVNPATGVVSLAAASSTSASLNTSKTVYFSSKVANTNQNYGAATKHSSGDKIYSVTDSTPTMTDAAGTKGTQLTAANVPAP